MFVVFIVAIVSTLLAYSASKGNKYGLHQAFILITLFFCFRYDFGSDYLAYLQMFNNINRYNIGLLDFNSLSIFSEKGELGWVLLNKLFNPFGFFGLIAFLSILENYIIFKMIKSYVPVLYQWLAVFIFSFSPALFLIGPCSMLRQWLAVVLFLYSIKYIASNNYIKYFIITAIAISVHTSAWIMAPIYLFSFIKKINFRGSKLLIYVVSFYILWTIFAPSVFSNNLSFLLDFEDFSYYTNYLGDKQSNVSMSIFGLFSYVVMNLFLPFMVLLNLHKLKSEYLYFALLYLMWQLLLPLQSVVPMVSRLGYYFLIFNIIAIPIALYLYKGNYKKVVFCGVLLFMIFSARELSTLSSGASWKSFATYKTIFSVPYWL